MYLYLKFEYTTRPSWIDLFLYTNRNWFTYDNYGKETSDKWPKVCYHSSRQCKLLNCTHMFVHTFFNTPIKVSKIPHLYLDDLDILYNSTVHHDITHDICVYIMPTHWYANKLKVEKKIRFYLLSLLVFSVIEQGVWECSLIKTGRKKRLCVKWKKWNQWIHYQDK